MPIVLRRDAREKRAAGVHRAAAVLFFLALTLAAATGRGEEDSRGLKVGQVLPPRILMTLDQQETALPAREGVTVVVFWSTWSARSGTVLRYWDKMQEEYAASHPFHVLAVDADHQKMEESEIAAVRAYLKDNLIDLPVVIDQGLTLYNEVAVRSLPTTLFLKSDGTLLEEMPGFPSSAVVEMKATLDRLMGISPPEQEKPHRGELAYQPKNNALLYYSMGVNLRKVGMKEKAREKFVEALKRDTDYLDPLKALEEDFFRDGQNAASETALRKFLLDRGLPAMAEHYQGQ